MHAALDINMPNYASAIVSTEEIVAANRCYALLNEKQLLALFRQLNSSRTL